MLSFFICFGNAAKITKDINRVRQSKENEQISVVNASKLKEAEENEDAVNEGVADDSDDAEDDDESENSEAEKNAVQTTNNNTSLSIWGMVRGLWNWIKNDLSESLLDDDDASSSSAVGKLIFYLFLLFAQ